jgi:hypothetical protein
MLYVNRKIYEILNSDFGIQQVKISENTNLIQAFNLCDWELELLYYKLEVAFKIEIKKTVPKDEMSFKTLQQAVNENLCKH